MIPPHCCCITFNQFIKTLHHSLFKAVSCGHTIAATVDGTVAASTNTLTGREDFTFTVNGGSGNDALTLNIDPTFASVPGDAWAVDQAMLKNISISGGDGNDTIRTPGAGIVKIDAGSGNDTVYTDNSGAKTASWFVSEANAIPVAANLQGVPANNAAQFLYKGKMTVTFAAATFAASVTTGDAAALANGYEVVVDIPTGANYSTNQYNINQAIKTAINGDAVLSKLLSAVDGPANTLVITSLTDGVYIDNDLLMTISAPDLTVIGAGGVASAGEQATALTAFKAFMNAQNLGDSTDTIIDAQAAQAATVLFDNAIAGMGVNQVIVSTATVSAEESDNIINLGAGTDVLVLGTGALSNETLTISGYDQGKNTIVNFDSTAPAVNGGDWLTNLRTLSGSVESQQRIATTDVSVTATVAEANSVSEIAGVFTTTDTFAGLTAAKLLAAINTTGNVAYAGINSAMLDALTTYVTAAGANNLVGGVGKAVVLVANNLNVGEYAAFELTFNGLATNLNGDFTAATLIGTYDFGNAAGFAGNIVA